MNDRPVWDMLPRDVALRLPASYQNERTDGNNTPLWDLAYELRQNSPQLVQMNIILFRRLIIREKKLLHTFACPNRHNTVTWPKLLSSLTVDLQPKHWMLGLAQEVETEIERLWYTDLCHKLRAAMEDYYRAKRHLHLVKETAEYEEDLYDEAV